jgi:ribosomal protein S12 methylthiotransferase accessory factor YcaO
VSGRSVLQSADGRGVERLRLSNLRPSPKYASYGVVRTVAPKETIRRVLPMLEAIGVTRVADVTGLDRVGIPNFTTVRPREPGFGISYYNGKGATRSAAKAGALMEALERHTGERCDLPVYCYTQAEMQRRGPTLDPSQIMEPSVRRYEPDVLVEWVEGHDLLADEPTFVPLNAVVCPYKPAGGAKQLFYSHTNGLASGNTVEDALCHAICEVLERDAVALSDAQQLLAHAVRRLLADAGLQYAAPDSEPVRAQLVDLDTLPPRSRRLVKMMREAGLLVYIRNLTSALGIATFDCLSVERKLDGRHLVHYGSGTHPDARVAVSRSVTEAAQSRVAHIQGGREDLTEIVRTPAPFDPDEVYGAGERISFAAVRSYENANIDDDIRLMLRRLAEIGFRQVVAVDLTHQELGVPVIRVVIPGAETWSVFFAHGQRARLGARANHVLCDAICGTQSQ